VLLGLLAVPVYLSQVGQEAYALVGAFATLQALCTALDMGLGATLTRELAKTTTEPSSAQRGRNLVRTLEGPYWAVAALIALASFAAAGPVAEATLDRWTTTLGTGTIRTCGLLMGLTVAAQLPFTLYGGGLLGLQRQVLYNGILVVTATVRVAASVLVLKFVSPTMEAFFLCQLGVSALQTVVTFVALRRALPPSPAPAAFDGPLLGECIRFAAGVAGITVVSLLLTQTDKVVLTQYLTPRRFAAYAMATSCATVLPAVAQPVFTAVFARFSQVVADRDAAAEVREYHRASQTLAVLVFPAAVMLALFAHPILLAWTGKPAVADDAAAAASLLAVGSVINAAMHVPYALMLAHGWTKLTLVTNLVAVSVLVPLLVWASSTYGMTGAATVWCALNVSYLLVSIPLMHRRLLRTEALRWYLWDTGVPMIASLAGVLAADLALPAASSRAWTIARLLAVGAGGLLAAIAAAPEVRRPLLRKFR
jgi:O-antigen/teichoic acid export membrane protein